MVSAELARRTFAAGKAYDAYVGGGSAAEQASWGRVRERVRLTEGQLKTVRGFTRQLNVLVSSGLWCGDCAAQCPIFAAIAAANPQAVDLRFVDRDEWAELASAVTICGGRRVPTMVFLSEDFEFVALAGDKSLSRLRASAAKALGASCPLPGAEVPADELAATIADWVNDFERAHLLVRLSTKLRQRHGD